MTAIFWFKATELAFLVEATHVLIWFHRSHYIIFHIIIGCRHIQIDNYLIGGTATIVI